MKGTNITETQTLNKSTLNAKTIKNTAKWHGNKCDNLHSS